MQSAPSRSQTRIATTAIFCCNGLGIGAWATSIPHFRARFGLDDGRLGVVLFAVALGATVAMPIAGRSVARFGSGVQTRVAAIAFALSLAAPALATTLPALVASALVLGAANGFLDIAMNARASELERGAPAIMSSFHAAFSIGAALGAVLGGALAFAAVRTDVLGIAAAVTFAIALACWPWIGAGERTASVAFAWPRGAAGPLAAAAVLGMMCEGATSDWTGVYLATIAHAPVRLLAAGFGAFSAAMVAGRLSGDRWTRAFGERRVVRAGAALACCGFATAALVPRTPVALVAFACVGLGVANVVPILYSASGRIGSTAASGIAMTATAGYAGFLAGPPLIGAISAFGNLRAAFGVLALFAAIVAAIGVPMPSPRATSR